MISQKYFELKRELFDLYYSELNDMQKKSIYCINGPTLILAGAGSGKTTVLVNRITHMLRYGNAYYSDILPGVYDDSLLSEIENARSLSKEELGIFLERFACDVPAPWSVLAITFTNKAANEIKKRLTESLGDGCNAADDIWTGTFHSVCMRLIRKYGDSVGYSRDVGICDTDDAKKLITDCMKKLNIDTKNLPVKTVMNQISRAKDNLQSAVEFSKSANGDYKLKQIARIYEMYSARLLESNLLDFDDIIMQTVNMLRFNEELRLRLQNKFKYVLVDEFQDTNPAQLELTLLLSGGYDNIMVVGDDDQSIYKFRGASIENILSFDKRYKENVTVIRLEQNYRSTKNILDAANAVISKNTGRHPKSLWCAGERGDTLSLVKLPTQLDEAKYISDTVAELVNDGTRSYKDFAVLYRMNAQSRSIEQALARAGIPYRLLGGTRFFDRAEIRDMLAYLCVINNPTDNIHLKRIINVPKRGIGASSVEKAEILSSSLGISMLELMKNATSYPALPGAAAKAMVAFAELIDELKVCAEEGTLSELIRRVAELSGYEKMLESLGEAESDRLDNLGELVSTAVQFEESTDSPTLSNFLVDVALVSDVDKYDESADAVVLMTVHSAKGLEFPVVFIPGVEDGVFPGYQSMFNDTEIEEERRLCYVAITRAKHKLYLIHVRERMINGSTQFNKLSRFISDIPEHLLTEDDRTESNNSIFSDVDVGSIKSHRPERFVSSVGSQRKRMIDKNFGSISSGPRINIGITEFNVGDQVKHVTFGNGTVLGKKPMGGDILYEIEFQKVGVKKLMASYARLSSI